MLGESQLPPAAELHRRPQRSQKLSSILYFYPRPIDDLCQDFSLTVLLLLFVFVAFATFCNQHLMWLG
jgi:hypothetical protein